MIAGQRQQVHFWLWVVGLGSLIFVLWLIWFRNYTASVLAQTSTLSPTRGLLPEAGQALQSFKQHLKAGFSSDFLPEVFSSPP